MIILWLAKDEFSLDTIPLSLLNLRERGLQIRFCDDIKAYKKLVPSLECFPGEIIITADDDILYPRDFVESLVASYKSAPHLIHFCRGHQIRLTENNQPLPYNKWGHQITDTKESFLNFPTSGGGVLYPPDCFHKDITNRDTFMKLCPTADDVWYKAMSILKRTSCKLAYRSLPWEEMFIENTIHKNLRLFNVNVVQNQNDKQIQNVFDHYKLSEILTNIE
ncbi:hypothetical protein [Pinibacter soli]|uniref:Glycosyltransferase n=1 Tax=Pinibacter soli TaxID=3044211 RepID=A0ABT6RHT0_9BACT|nr:hypothetical protein [Pinibacter soli]MDI3322137.1 hypothetical protein [Pinibacter soli]